MIASSSINFSDLEKEKANFSISHNMLREAQNNRPTIE